MTAKKRVKHKLTKVGDRTVMSVIIDGEPEMIDDSHPNWDKILAAAKADDPKIKDLINTVKNEVAMGFHRLSDRLTIRDRNVYWDGDRMNNALTEKILDFYAEGHGFMPLVNFFDKVSQNPQKESQEQLYHWLATHKFTITEDGDILGYKGYATRKPNDASDGNMQSTASGHAFVNDKEFRGNIPCKIGDIVTMPRSEVNHNPSAECSHGLHIGTPSYSRSYGSVRMAVLINPRDVVSVPRHDAYQKMRVCRYYVLERANADIVTALKKGAPAWEPKKPVKPDVERSQEEAGLGEVPEQPKSSILADEKTTEKVKPKRTTTRTRPPTTPARRGGRAAPTKDPAKPATKGGKAAGKDEEAKANTEKAKKAKAGDTLPPKPEPGNGTNGPTKVDWNDPKNVDTLLACPNNEAMKRAFPGLALSTLQRRAREERAKREKQ